VTLSADAGDERVRTARLTPEGLAEVDEMNRRADQVAERTLAPLTDSQRRRLVAAMAEVNGLMKAAGAVLERVDPASPAARWCVARYFAELAERFEEGFDPGRSLPADDDDMRPPRGVFVVASVDGEAVAGGGLKPCAPGIASLKRMWVSPSVRGLGFGRRMLGALEQQARELGYATVRLETNRALTEAITLYRTSGYAEVPAFNDDPYACHWFEKHLG
jgi:GNAT superfamily N-acetyltransferase